MSSNAVFKKSLLAVAVAMGVSSFSTMALATCPEGTTVGTVCAPPTKPDEDDKLPAYQYDIESINVVMAVV